MGYEQEDHADVRLRCAELGVEPPSDLALLPVNLVTAGSPEELLFSVETPTVAKLWSEEGVTASVLGVGAAPRYQALQSAEWIGPTIFVSSALLSGNEDAVQLALGVVANYVTDLFKGAVGGGRARLDVVVETKKGCKRVHYDGPPDGLEQLPSIIREARKSADEG